MYRTSTLALYYYSYLLHRGLITESVDSVKITSKHPVSYCDVIVLSEIWSYNIELHRNLSVDNTLYYDLPMSSSVGGVAVAHATPALKSLS